MLHFNGHLSAYFVSPTPIDSDELIKLCEKALPYYAIPTDWIWKQRMPLTPNGKIDKKLLRTPPIAPASDFITPLTLPAYLPELLPSVSASEASMEEVMPPKSDMIVSTVAMPNSQEFLSEKEIELPAERGRSTHMVLRYHFFNIYRRLFSLVFVSNVVCFLTVFAYRRTFNNLTLGDLAIATASNVTAALLMRQDYVINLLFTVACSVPTSWPLFIRRICAKIFHIGGIHSSAGIASVIWFFAFLVAVLEVVHLFG